MAMVANMGNASLILWSFKDSLTTGLFQLVGRHDDAGQPVVA